VGGTDGRGLDFDGCNGFEWLGDDGGIVLSVGGARLFISVPSVIWISGRSSTLYAGDGLLAMLSSRFCDFLRTESEVSQAICGIAYGLLYRLHLRGLG
jgi:hypothetical protein